MKSHADSIPDRLILAAIDRAIRHRGEERHAITGSVYEHLAVRSRSGAARHVHQRLLALEEAEAVERSSRHGFIAWGLTRNGRRRLNRAQRSGAVELPESPQHRAWRDAKTLAGQEIERFREALRDAITEALELVDSEPDSDALFALAERLHSELRRLASAIYCLNEWAEPDDAHPDTDERLTPAEQKLDRAHRARLRAQRAGRRNIWRWSEQHTTREQG